MRANEFIINERMDEEEGLEWEENLIETWSPKAGRYMAKAVQKSFNSLYPNVKIKVWADNETVIATTDISLQPDEVDPDVFNQRDNPNWECNFTVAPLYHMEDNTAYLELMVNDASSGQYKGVWKLIAKDWALWANKQLKSTGAEAVCFSVDEDHSDAWQHIAAQAGLKYIVHN
jgi:hypothetical protein